MDARAALVIGFVGILVVSGVGSMTDDAEKPPAEASITANLTATPRTLHFNETKHIRVAMSGEPKEGPTSIVDATGLRVATVESVSDSECTDEPIRSTGVGLDIWCLRVSGIDVGSELSGKIEGESSNLTLKLTERYHFFWAPLLVTALGLLLSVLWTWATTKGLPDRVPLSKLNRALKKNRSAAHKIEGLDEWSRTLRPSKGADAIRQAIEEIHSTGIPNAKKSRLTLKDAIAKSTLLADHPLVVAALVESKRHDHKIGDFFGEDGKAVDVHPAAAFTKLLDDAERLRRRIGAAVDDIRTRVPDALREKLLAQVEAARQPLMTASDSEALDNASAVVGLLEQAVFAAVGATDQAGQDRFLITDAEELGAFVVEIGAETPPRRTALGLEIEPSIWKPAEILDNALASGAVLGFLILVQGIVAIYTVAMAVYWPNQSFGTVQDWLGLFAAAFASSAAAAILGLAAIGELKKPTT